MDSLLALINLANKSWFPSVGPYSIIVYSCQKHMYSIARHCKGTSYEYVFNIQEGHKRSRLLYEYHSKFESLGDRGMYDYVEKAHLLDKNGNWLDLDAEDAISVIPKITTSKISLDDKELSYYCEYFSKGSKSKFFKALYVGWIIHDFRTNPENLAKSNENLAKSDRGLGIYNSLEYKCDPRDVFTRILGFRMYMNEKIDEILKNIFY